jgi:hypothetical protein
VLAADRVAGEGVRLAFAPMFECDARGRSRRPALLGRILAAAAVTCPLAQPFDLLLGLSECLGPLEALADLCCQAAQVVDLFFGGLALRVFGPGCA